MELFYTVLVMCIFSSVKASDCNIDSLSNAFSVMKYGAVGDGKTDDSQAFLKAWADVCAASNKPILYVPSGKTFLLKEATFQGPCMASSIYALVHGTIVAPEYSKALFGDGKAQWLTFAGVNGLSVTGKGRIDGKGSGWWSRAEEISDRPIALSFSQCNNLVIEGLTHINSPSVHVHVYNSTGISISNLYIYAPEESPNTDGIDVGNSTNVQISRNTISTGDDCVAITGSTYNVSISEINCGPGHGISIGSLGKRGQTDTVEEVHVRNSVFRGTTNGARIKTWQGGSGYARKISFEQITLVAVKNPIIIDQFYCNGGHDCTNQTSAVKVSDVTYKSIHGTLIDDDAIVLDCSETVGCTNLVFEDIDIVPARKDESAEVHCLNAHGSTDGNVVPELSCLEQ